MKQTEQEIKAWSDGNPYENFMGRWSKLIAPVFLEWLKFPKDKLWLELGCGTGALSEAICQGYDPLKLCCIDPSPAFLENAKARIKDKAEFVVGDASDIPQPNEAFDIVVSGLALNFFPDLHKAFSEMKRVLKPNGTIGAYIWDYADRMDMLKLFWDSVYERSPGVRQLHEGVRFAISSKEKLNDAFLKAGLSEIATSYLEINTIFKNFEDYWNPFLGGQGPAGVYLLSLDEQGRNELKNTLQKKLPVEADGSIKLLARAIAARGVHKP